VGRTKGVTPQSEQGRRHTGRAGDWVRSGAAGPAPVVRVCGALGRWRHRQHQPSARYLLKQPV